LGAVGRLRPGGQRFRLEPRPERALLLDGTNPRHELGHLRAQRRDVRTELAGLTAGPLRQLGEAPVELALAGVDARRELLELRARPCKQPGQAFLITLDTVDAAIDVFFDRGD